MIPPVSANNKIPVIMFNILDPSTVDETNISLKYDHKLIDHGTYFTIVVWKKKVPW